MWGPRGRGKGKRKDTHPCPAGSCLQLDELPCSQNAFTDPPHLCDHQHTPTGYLLDSSAQMACAQPSLLTGHLNDPHGLSTPVSA